MQKHLFPFVLASLTFMAGCSGDDSSSGGGSGGTGAQASGGQGGSGASTFGGNGGTAGSGATGGNGGIGGNAASGGNGATGGAGATGGSGGSAGAATGDRYVATNGADSGDCTTNPCKTLDYAGQQLQSGEVLVIKDGSYADSIDEKTFPKGSASAFTIVRAEHDAETTITGNFDLYENDDLFLQFEGLRFEGAGQKGVAGGNVRFYRVAFIGGPATGNSVSFGIGTNDFQPGAWDVLCEDCIFRGPGGRYAAMVYRGQNVTLRRAVARKDGGWGIGSSSATDFEPEGVIMFYETKDSKCEQCVALDSLKLSHSSAEALGALIQNSHTNQHTNVVFSECFAVANSYSGIAFEGNGSVGNASVTDSYSVQNSANGITSNVDGSITLTAIASLDNDNTGVASYGGASVTLTNSKVSGNGSQLSGVSGSTTGAGPHAIDLTGFDSARLHLELCELPAVTRGFCAGTLSFQDYLESFE